MLQRENESDTTKQMRVKPFAFNCMLVACLSFGAGCDAGKSESDAILENYVRVPYDQYIDNDAYYVAPNTYYRTPPGTPDDLD